MDQKLQKKAEAFGIETKGKTDLQLMAEIDELWKSDKTTIEQNVKQQSIDNGVNLLPNIKKQFEKPFEVWIEKIQNGKKPECLPVVGYNPQTSEFIVCKEVKSDTGKSTYKLYQVSEKLVITSAKKLDDIIARLKAERAAAAAKAKDAKAAKESGTKKSKK